jgi:ABC-type transporter Mla subunit MlaD
MNGELEMFTEDETARLREVIEDARQILPQLKCLVEKINDIWMELDELVDDLDHALEDPFA